MDNRLWARTRSQCDSEGDDAGRRLRRPLCCKAVVPRGVRGDSKESQHRLDRVRDQTDMEEEEVQLLVAPGDAAEALEPAERPLNSGRLR